MFEVHEHFLVTATVQEDYHCLSVQATSRTIQSIVQYFLNVLITMSLGSWRAYLANQSYCNFKVTENPLTASFTHPGFNFTSFDRDHNVNILYLLQVVVDFRTFATYQPYNDRGDTFLDFLKATQDCYTFVSSSEFSISRAMYDKSLPKWPLDVKVRLGFIGNSTVVLPLEVNIPGSQEPILRQMNQIVVVNKATRRPTPFPEWFRNKYKNQVAMDEGFKLKTFQRPEKTFMYARKVMWTDTDQNDHTNYGSYVRYLIDGLHLALRQESGKDKDAVNISLAGVSDSAKSINMNASSRSEAQLVLRGSGESNSVLKNNSSGIFKGMTKDIVKAGVKNMKVCYVHECADGDLVDIHLWQEEGEEFTIRSSIEKGSLVLCQIVIEFFTPKSNL